jgi:hypothetical protein
MGDEVLGAAFRQDQNALRNAELKLIVTLDSSDWRNLMERIQPIDVAEKLLREISAIDPEQTGRAMDYLRSWSGRGERHPRRVSLLQYLLELGDNVHYAGACRFQGIPQQQDRTGFGRVHRLARAVRLLHDNVQMAQTKWQVLPHGGAAGGGEPAADIAAFNEAFAGVFGAIFGIRNLDSGAVSCLTAAGIALFMDYDRRDAPNPYLSCVVSADSLQPLLIS